MQRIYFLLCMIFLTCSLSNCTYSNISQIKTKHLKSECVRECTKIYSNCVSEGNQVGFKTETLRACKEGYKACLKTCPPK